MLSGPVDGKTAIFHQNPVGFYKNTVKLTSWESNRSMQRARICPSPKVGIPLKLSNGDLSQASYPPIITKSGLSGRSFSGCQGPFPAPLSRTASSQSWKISRPVSLLNGVISGQLKGIRSPVRGRNGRSRKLGSRFSSNYGQTGQKKG